MPQNHNLSVVIDVVVVTVVEEIKGNLQVYNLATCIT